MTIALVYPHLMETERIMKARPEADFEQAADAAGKGIGAAAGAEGVAGLTSWPGHEGTLLRGGRTG